MNPARTNDRRVNTFIPSRGAEVDGGMTGPGLFSLASLAYCRHYSASAGAGIDELFCFAVPVYFVKG
jgi:hypothetical protein